MGRKYSPQNKEVTPIDDRIQNEISTAESGKKSVVLSDLTKEELELEQKIKEKMGNKFLKLRISKEFASICEMALSGVGAPDIRKHLIANDPDNFHPETEEEIRVLDRMINRFKVDLFEWVGIDSNAAAIESQVPISLLDYNFIKYKDRPFTIIAMMEKAILVQETRLDRALKLEAGKKFVMDSVNKELQTYFGLLKELGTYKKLVGLPDDGQSKFHQVTEGFSNMLNYYKSLTPENRDEFKEHLRRLAAANGARMGTVDDGVRNGESKEPQ